MLLIVFTLLLLLLSLYFCCCRAHNCVVVALSTKLPRAVTDPLFSACLSTVPTVVLLSLLLCDHYTSRLLLLPVVDNCLRSSTIRLLHFPLDCTVIVVNFKQLHNYLILSSAIGYCSAVSAVPLTSALS